jgi:hypothetical protein
MKTAKLVAQYNATHTHFINKLEKQRQSCMSKWAANHKIHGVITTFYERLSTAMQVRRSRLSAEAAAANVAAEQIRKQLIS